MTHEEAIRRIDACGASLPTVEQLEERWVHELEMLKLQTKIDMLEFKVISLETDVKFYKALSKT